MIKTLNIILSLFFFLLLMLGCFIVFYKNNFYSFLFTIGLPILFLINLFYLCYWTINKKIYLIGFIISLGVYYALFDSFFQINFKKTTSNVDRLSILTFNTRSFNLNHDIEKHLGDDKIVDFIKNEKPDIICIQEFSAIKYKEFDKYPYWFKTNIITRNKSVMAIFSKYPFVDKGYINFPNSSNGAMYTDIVYKNQVFRLYNIHLQSFGMEMNSDKKNDIQKLNLYNTISETTKLQKEQAEIIKNHTKSFEGKIILTGDFNSTQFSSPYSIFKKNRKDSFIEAGTGLGTTYRLFHYPLRLDFILCDEDINVITHRNYKIGLSDHEPILVELKMN